MHQPTPQHYVPHYNPPQPQPNFGMFDGPATAPAQHLFEPNSQQSIWFQNLQRASGQEVHADIAPPVITEATQVQSLPANQRSVDKKEARNSKRRSARLRAKNNGKFKSPTGKQPKQRKKRDEKEDEDPFDFTKLNLIDVPISLDQAQTTLQEAGIPLRADLKEQMEEIVRAEERAKVGEGTSKQGEDDINGTKFNVEHYLNEE